MAKRRFEVATSGADEGLQGLSADPFGGRVPAWTGLRIPSLVNTPDTRYLMLLSTRTITNGSTKVCGIRQGLEIGMDLSTQLEIDVERPVSLLVTTPTFRFSDGANVSWHLVKEPMQRRTVQKPLTQTASFAFVESDSPAMIYQDFTTSNPTGLGQPSNYALDLTSYTPPSTYADWQPIAGIKAMHDIRYPWQSDHAWDSINEDVPGTWRISLYASILQTNPATRPGIVYGEGIATDGSANGGPPEEDFIKKFSFSGDTPAGPQFWRVYGSILFEDEIAEDAYANQKAKIDPDRSRR